MTDCQFKWLSDFCERLQPFAQSIAALVLVISGVMYFSPSSTSATQKRATIAPSPRPARNEPADPWKVARRDRCIEYRTAQKLDGSVCWDDGHRVHATGMSNRGVPVNYTCDEKRCWWGN